MFGRGRGAETDVDRDVFEASDVGDFNSARDFSKSCASFAVAVDSSSVDSSAVSNAVLRINDVSDFSEFPEPSKAPGLFELSALRSFVEAESFAESFASIVVGRAAATVSSEFASSDFGGAGGIGVFVVPSADRTAAAETSTG